MNNPQWTVRPYRQEDRDGVRVIFGEDEFARPLLAQKYPRMSIYLADSMAHYYDREPESTFVAVSDGDVVGALLGSTDTLRTDHRRQRFTRPLLLRRSLTGTYGWPVWVFADLRTDRANRRNATPEPDLRQYPAHLHIGVLPDWRRRGIGTALMQRFAEYLRSLGIPGFHLYASSFHPLGVAFYTKLNMSVLGQFEWRFCTGPEWMTVTETIFGRAPTPQQEDSY